MDMHQDNQVAGRKWQDTATCVCALLVSAPLTEEIANTALWVLWLLPLSFSSVPWKSRDVWKLRHLRGGTLCPELS